jgi:hypothetical protein
MQGRAVACLCGEVMGGGQEMDRGVGPPAESVPTRRGQSFERCKLRFGEAKGQDMLAGGSAGSPDRATLLASVSNL